MQAFKQFTKVIFVIACIGGVSTSCKKKSDDPTPETPVVTTTTTTPSPVVYQGDEANMADAKTRMAMFIELNNYTKKGNTTKTFVDSVVMRQMLDNTGSPFTSAALNSATVNINSAIEPGRRIELLGLFKRLSEASTSQVLGSDGVAGVVPNIGATTGKLYDDKGFAPYELIEKVLMGSFQAYQISAVKLTSFNLAASNANRLKDWDMAFAYLGVTNDFINYLVTKPSLPFWGNYLKSNDVALGNNVAKIMTAFVNGRAAIVANEQAKVIENATIIKTELDRTAAGMALSYQRKGRAAIITFDPGRRNGTISEGLGFLYAMRSNPLKKATAGQINELIARIGANNWANTTTTNVEQNIEDIASIYSLDYSVFN